MDLALLETAREGFGSSSSKPISISVGRWLPAVKTALWWRSGNHLYHSIGFHLTQFDEKTGCVTNNQNSFKSLHYDLWTHELGCRLYRQCTLYSIITHKSYIYVMCIWWEEQYSNGISDTNHKWWWWWWWWWWSKLSRTGKYRNHTLASNLPPEKKTPTTTGTNPTKVTTYSRPQSAHVSFSLLKVQQRRRWL